MISHRYSLVTLRTLLGVAFALTAFSSGVARAADAPVNPATATAPEGAPKAKGPNAGKKKAAATKDGKPAEPNLAPATPEVLKSEVTAPPEFEVSVFATPQQANYPVYVAASPEGTVYVASDGNGSLGTQPGRGRIIRLRDT